MRPAQHDPPPTTEPHRPPIVSAQTLNFAGQTHSAVFKEKPVSLATWKTAAHTQEGTAWGTGEEGGLLVPGWFLKQSPWVSPATATVTKIRIAGTRETLCFQRPRCCSFEENTTAGEKSPANTVDQTGTWASDGLMTAGRGNEQ